jgi:two-component system cell cycle sensor histidine kinase/response regulator CckA
MLWVWAGTTLAILALLAGTASLSIGLRLGIGALIAACLFLAGWYWTWRPNLARFRAGRRDALLAIAVRNSRDGWMITDRANHGVHVNQAYRDLVGAAARSDPPTPEALFAEETLRDRVSRLRRSAEAGVDASDELPLPARDGSIRWLKISADSLAELPGDMLWRVEDVTVAHEMQEAIRAEQEKLADFIDNAPVGFYSADREGRFQFVNGTLAGWLGRTPADLAGGALRLADVIAFDEALGQDEMNQGEARLTARDGGERRVRITQSLVRGPEGDVIISRSVVHDLTEELAWRRALRQAEEHFRHFFDFAPIGIVVLDDAQRAQEANAAFRAMLGAAGDCIGRRFVELVKEPDRREVGERLASAKGDGGPLEVRLNVVPERVAQLYISRLQTDSAGVSGRLLHLIDTTEQKNLEVQFAQSQKMQAVGQLAGGIAHDFNNLLTAMIGFCDLLLLRHQAGDQSFADIMQIKQNANRAANLVRQLLAFSRQQTMRPKVLIITDVLAELSNLLRRLIGETIELKILHGRDLGLVKVDQGQFEQVIINLAVNARDAMPDGGTLTIRTGNVTAEESTRLGHELLPAGDYVLIEVIDTGKGIAAEDLGKIFEPFFTTKEVGAGTGLGLSTVYGIVKQTGGFVFPISQLGHGATFKIYLPRHRPASSEEVVGADTAERRDGADLTGKGTVLLVEDEDAVRIFAARALRNKGYMVIEASSGEGALAKVAEHRGTIDVLISDVVMPNMDGPTLAKHVRDSRSEIKIIFISGYAEDAFRRNLDREVEINFLPKPFSLKQLAGKVKEVLGQPGA